MSCPAVQNVPPPGTENLQFRPQQSGLRNFMVPLNHQSIGESGESGESEKSVDLYNHQGSMVTNQEYGFSDDIWRVWPQGNLRRRIGSYGGGNTDDCIGIAPEQRPKAGGKNVPFGAIACHKGLSSGTARITALGAKNVLKSAIAPDRDRTCDLRFRKPLLYPLSYER